MRFVQKKVTFQSGGLVLEGVVASGEAGCPAVVMCHPHPLYGGDMDSAVVTTVCQELETRGIASLRFNFRGVGLSEGTHDAGKGETEDLRAAISALAGSDGIDPERIGVAGYSFGATVAMEVAATDVRVKTQAAISMPLTGREPNPPTDLTGPSLLITGNMDQFVPIDRLEKLAGEMTGPAECRIVEGADHFWGPLVGEMGETVNEFFSRHLG